MTIRRSAHAKLNLCLSVGPAQPADAPRAGWHPIASWTHAIDLRDDVAVTPVMDGEARARPDIAWHTDAPRPSPIDWPIEKDLCARAHRLLERHAGRPLPARIGVRKRIPLGAGLGGGSADAAATLLALNEAFDIGLEPAALRALSASLGSDAAFFIDRATPPRPALVAGFGDRIERLDPIAGRVLLLIPPFPCATPEVYRAFDALGGGRGEPARDEAVRASARRGRTEGLAGVLFNDLLTAAEHVAPGLSAVRRAAERAAGRPVALTGSGSCLFIRGGDLDAVARDVRPALASDADPGVRGTVVLAARLV